MKNLLITGAFKYTDEQISMLEDMGYKTTYVQDERLPLQIDVSDINAVVCNSLFLYNDISHFRNLEMIQLTSAGMERIPQDEINKRGIKIYNARGVYSIPMAEWVILKILELYKDSKFFYNNQEKNKWEKKRDILELSGKTAAIIGYGSVGTEIAKRLKVFGVKIISVDIKQNESNHVDESVLMTDLRNVLKRSDINILTLPYTDETKHIINRDTLNDMKSDAIIINVGRGGVIDEKELVKSIKDNKLLGAALDVFEDEPLEKSPLWNLKNVIITPHNSFISDRVNSRLFKLIEESLRMNLEVTR